MISEKICKNCKLCELRPELTHIARSEKHRAICNARIPRYTNFLVRTDRPFNRQINLTTSDPLSKYYNENHWDEDCPLYIPRDNCLI